MVSQSTAYPAVFTPLRVGGLTWRNRIEVAPAAPFLNWREPDGRQPLKAYYRALAASGAAVVTLGISSLDDDPRSPGTVRPACAQMPLAELPELVDVLHGGGALAGIELTVMRYMMGGKELVSAMPRTEIQDIIASYVRQARRARAAGFDMLLIHGGHGNVPAQFFSARVNKRTDEYGGNLRNRSRFALELLDALRDAVGTDMALEYRISAEEILPGATTLEETLEFAALAQDKIDLLHVSRGLLDEDETLPYINSPTYLPRGGNIPFARQFKQALRIPVCVVCGMDLATAETAIAAGDIDAAAMIRTVLADPLCAAKAQAGRADTIRPCVRCNTCIGRTHSQRLPVRCAVNPLLGRESEFTASEPSAKKVVVVGGGPAGLEAARTAAARGCRVTLLEKSAVLGGTLRLASAAAFKADMRAYLDWAIRAALRQENLEIRLQTEATPSLLRSLAPDAILLAVGAKPILPAIKTCPEKAVWVGELEHAPEKAGQRVVIAGAGFTGLEMALQLSRLGREVTMVDLLPAEKIGADGVAISMIWLKAALREAGVRFVCRARLTDADAAGACVSLENGERLHIPCDTLVLSLGVRPDADAADALRGLAPLIKPIGDCAGGGGTLFHAISTAFVAAMDL